MKILIEVAWQFNPRKLSDVMAQMQTESAEKLTVEMANRAPTAASPWQVPELPKMKAGQTAVGPIFPIYLPYG